jgi:hypothetical protein
MCFSKLKYFFFVFPTTIPLKKKHLFYTRTQCILCSKHSPPWLYKNQTVMLYKAKVTVFSEIRKNTPRQVEHHTDIFHRLHLVLHNITTRL